MSTLREVTQNILRKAKLNACDIFFFDKISFSCLFYSNYGLKKNKLEKKAKTFESYVGKSGGKKRGKNV